MELLTVIMLICGAENAGNTDLTLKCHQYYTSCYQEYMNNPSHGFGYYVTREAHAVAKCILKRKP